MTEIELKNKIEQKKSELKKRMDKMLHCEEKIILLATESLAANKRFMNAPTDSEEEAETSFEYEELSKMLAEYVKKYVD